MCWRSLFITAADKESVFIVDRQSQKGQGKSEGVCIECNNIS
jgi:hypothetical protein